MMYRIYLIRDTAVDAFLVPMFFQSEDMLVVLLVMR